MALKQMEPANRYLEKAIGLFNDIINRAASDGKLLFADYEDQIWRFYYVK
ncbi:hypothetical protein QFZ31_003298 [Neobacillus niacini]|nr:hypothetical protein [Neobacillus niacini]